MHPIHTLPLLLALPLAAQSSWATPVNEAALNSTAADTGIHLAADGRSCVFVSYRGGNWDIYSATRTGRGAPWSTPVAETVLNDASGTEGDPATSADGLEIFFSSTRAGTAGGSDLMRATRATPAAPWSAPAFVTELNSPGADGAPSLTGDGLRIYFLSARPGAPNPPNNAIFTATRPNRQSPWSTPALVAELATQDTHRDVDVALNGNELLFTRFNAGISRIEVQIARRAKPADPFGAPAVIGEFATVGTSLGVYSVSVSRDRTEMLLAAGFASAAGGQEILSTRFTGLGQDGLVTAAGSLRLHFRDPAAPSLPCLGALALGDSPGTPFGTRTIPLNPDAVFFNTIGGVPGLTTGFAAVLDANGETTAQVGPSLPFLVGIKLYAGFFSMDAGAPLGVRTISNSIAFEFLP